MLRLAPTPCRSDSASVVSQFGRTSMCLPAVSGRSILWLRNRRRVQVRRRTFFDFPDFAQLSQPRTRGVVLVLVHDSVHKSQRPRWRGSLIGLVLPLHRRLRLAAWQCWGNRENHISQARQARANRFPRNPTQGLAHKSPPGGRVGSATTCPASSGAYCRGSLAASA